MLDDRRFIDPLRARDPEATAHRLPEQASAVAARGDATGDGSVSTSGPARTPRSPWRVPPEQASAGVSGGRDTRSRCLRAAEGTARLAAAVRAVAHLLPHPGPFAAPGEGAAAGCADPHRKISLAPHPRQSGLRPGFHLSDLAGGEPAESPGTTQRAFARLVPLPDPWHDPSRRAAGRTGTARLRGAHALTNVAPRPGSPVRFPCGRRA